MLFIEFLLHVGVLHFHHWFPFKSAYVLQFCRCFFACLIRLFLIITLMTFYMMLQYAIVLALRIRNSQRYYVDIQIFCQWIAVPCNCLRDARKLFKTCWYSSFTSQPAWAIKESLAPPRERTDYTRSFPRTWSVWRRRAHGPPISLKYFKLTWTRCGHSPWAKQPSRCSQ